MDYRGHCRLVCVVNSVEYLSYSFFCEERCLSLERDAKSVYPCQFMEKKGLFGKTVKSQVNILTLVKWKEIMVSLRRLFGWSFRCLESRSSLTCWCPGDCPLCCVGI